MMTRGLLTTGVLFLMITSAGFAQGFTAGDQTFTLAGSGSSDDDLVDNLFSVSAAWSYFMTDNWEIALRDTVDIVDTPGGDDDWNNTIRVALDWNFLTDGALVPFIGLSAGYQCGDSVEDSCIGGPEGGIRWFVNDTTYILVMAEYLFLFDSGDSVDDRFDDGSFLWTAGVGFKF